MSCAMKTIPLADARTVLRARHDALVRDAASTAPGMVGRPVDTRGRALADLRISVTDRCNFRCVYCMPKDVFGRDYPFLRAGQLLTFEEIARVARIFVGHGVRKIRLTGGEPLLRRNIERLIESLARIPDIDLTLTTNGALLANKARSLRDAGLKRVTVSLDSLDDATFRAMNDVDFPVAKVLDGIDCRGCGGPRADQSQHGGEARHERRTRSCRWRGTSRARGHIVRFIEYMDVGAHQWLAHGRRRARRGDRARDRPRAAARPPSIRTTRAKSPSAGATATATGEIGVIASVTQAFCRDCTRARLSTDGKLYTCLFATDGYDLRALLRERLRRRARSATRSPRSGAQRARPLLGNPHGEHAARRPKVEMIVHRRMTPVALAAATGAASHRERPRRALPAAAHRRRAPGDVRRRRASTRPARRATCRSRASIR